MTGPRGVPVPSSWKVQRSRQPGAVPEKCSIARAAYVSTIPADHAAGMPCDRLANARLAAYHMVLSDFAMSRWL
jgi:hypothetical protein